MFWFEWIKSCTVDRNGIYIWTWSGNLFQRGYWGTVAETRYKGRWFQMEDNEPWRGRKKIIRNIDEGLQTVKNLKR